MSLADDPRPPLSEWITDAYAVLSTHIIDSNSRTCHGQVPAIRRGQAVDLLCASETLELERADTEHAIKRLIDRGYLYQVDTELRVTTPAEDR
ncbi:hypothetical protein Htur_4836 (plasmid) [Haloterrigena turkmenica DSM 5511]|uniref:Uncharacterized protein n=1 Tax=Haloterrigena turkmenica (strain ATCC 51198 / DSM 5511 / JCM 9101 / NCIMB 13204 / VKM B-1734 / 4k) TaxID=543526 RepID=D2S2K0_HALTV|nr:hypothetical protein Htur_4836 [Haloterrigena turkmenica DSM 5511]